MLRPHVGVADPHVNDYMTTGRWKMCSGRNDGNAMFVSHLLSRISVRIHDIDARIPCEMFANRPSGIGDFDLSMERRLIANWINKIKVIASLIR